MDSRLGRFVFVIRRRVIANLMNHFCGGPVGWPVVNEDTPESLSRRRCRRREDNLCGPGRREQIKSSCVRTCGKAHKNKTSAEFPFPVNEGGWCGTMCTTKQVYLRNSSDASGWFGVGQVGPPGRPVKSSVSAYWLTNNWYRTPSAIIDRYERDYPHYGGNLGRAIYEIGSALVRRPKKGQSVTFTAKK